MSLPMNGLIKHEPERVFRLKNITTIVWDLDGTIIDSLGVFIDIITDTFPEYGIEIPSTEFVSAHFHGSLEETISSVIGVPIEDPIIGKIITSFLGHQQKYYEEVDSNIFDDAMAVITKAHNAGIRQIIVTNRAHDDRGNASPVSIVANTRLNGLIEQVIAGDSTEHRKPKIEVFSGKPPDADTTLVIGDQFVDVQFAGAIGARCIWIDRHNSHKHHGHKLDASWEDYTTIVTSLDSVEFN